MSLTGIDHTKCEQTIEDLREALKYKQRGMTFTESERNVELVRQIASEQDLSDSLAAALKALKEDYADSEGCYCGQIVGGTNGEGEPNHICGWCIAGAALAQHTAMRNKT